MWILTISIFCIELNSHFKRMLIKLENPYYNYINLQGKRTACYGVRHSCIKIMHVFILWTKHNGCANNFYKIIGINKKYPGIAYKISVKRYFHMFNFKPLAWLVGLVHCHNPKYNWMGVLYSTGMYKMYHTANYDILSQIIMWRRLWAM